MSKNNGIIRFPADYRQKSDTPYFSISGIDEKNLGEVLPNSRNVVDLTVGDSFEYETIDYNFGNMEVRDQYVITSKTGSNGNFQYGISGKQITFTYNVTTTYTVNNNPTMQLLTDPKQLLPLDFAFLEENYPLETSSEGLRRAPGWLISDNQNKQPNINFHMIRKEGNFRKPTYPSVEKRVLTQPAPVG